jgi:uncharacterized membrane protein YraQ (UPF0718 family)
MDIFSPAQHLADIVTYDWLSIPEGSHLADSVNYFVFDTVKIFFLLLLINYLMAVVRHYLPTEKIRHILTSKRWYGLDYILASVFGVVTPFCSCSSIPLFVGFLSAGIPLGVTTAFLITSPLVNEASLALFPGIFGMKFTLIYNLAGIVIGVTGGMLIQRFNMEKYVEPQFLNVKTKIGAENKKKPAMSELMKMWFVDGWTITKSIFPYVILGVGVGALIHGFVPAGFFEKYLKENQLWTVPLATLLGVPLYANSVGVIPIMQALISKGVPVGTALAFMTATVTLSIPEALILRRVMKLPLLITFFSVTTVGIVAMGYLFNALF